MIRHHKCSDARCFRL